MSDEIFRSMKEQMQPSDEVVSSLLDKIAQLEASPAPANVVAADFAATKETVVPAARRAGRSASKKFWYAGSCIAASVIVLVATLSIFGDGSDAGDAFQNVINDPDVAVSSVIDATKNETDDKTATAEIEKIESEDESIADNENNDASEVKDALVPEESKVTAPAKEEKPETLKPETKPEETQGKPEVKPEANPEKESEAAEAEEGNNDESGNPEEEVSGENEEKIDLGTEGSETIAFDEEILAEPSVSAITIDGYDFAYPTVVSSIDTEAEIGTIEIDIDETSKVNKTVVTATTSKLRSVSTKLMMALDIEGFDETLVYVNNNYSADTLGEMVSDAGIMHAAYSKKVGVIGASLGFNTEREFTVKDIDSVIATILADNESAIATSESVFNEASAYCTVKTPGSKNPTGKLITMMVSDNGVLKIEFGGKAHCFFIGEDVAADLINRVAGA